MVYDAIYTCLGVIVMDKYIVTLQYRNIVIKMYIEQSSSDLSAGKNVN